MSKYSHQLLVATAYIAPVAQMDRVLPSEGRGREFESRQARHLFQLLVNIIHKCKGYV